MPKDTTKTILPHVFASALKGAQALPEVLSESAVRDAAGHDRPRQMKTQRELDDTRARARTENGFHSTGFKFKDGEKR